MDQYLFDHCSPSQVPQLACCLKRRFSKVLLYDNLVFTQIYNLLPVWEVEFHIYWRLVKMKHSSFRVFAWVSRYYQSPHYETRAFYVILISWVTLKIYLNNESKWLWKSFITMKSILNNYTDFIYSLAYKDILIFVAFRQLFLTSTKLPFHLLVH